MSDSIIVALIALLGTLASGIIGIISANKVISVKIEALTEQVKKHNTLIDRMYRAETKIELIENDIKDIKETLHEDK